MKKWIITFCFLTLIITGNLSVLLAQDSDECSTLNPKDKVECLNVVLNKLSGKSKTLSTEVEKRKIQINLTSAQISKTEQDITSLSDKIGKLEISLDQLALMVNKRIVATYERGQTDPITLIFSSGKFSDFINRFRYLKAIQTHDKKLLYSMETTRTNYDEQKQAIEALKKKLEIQKKTLAGQKSNLENLLSITQNDEKKYQDLLKKAIAEVESLKRFSQDNKGGILPPQQSPDGWFYSQRDERWAKQMIGGSSETVYDVGCLIADLAMISTFYGDRKTPGDIAASSSYFYSDTAYMNYPWPSVAGKTYSALSNSSAMNNELSAGRPVIAHLSLGGDGHYIVIKKKEGDDYLIHDPWFGYDKKLKDYYSLNSIDYRRTGVYK